MVPCWRAGKLLFSKNVTADKESTVVIFLPCLSEVEISLSPGRRNMETRISLLQFKSFYGTRIMTCNFSF